MAALVYMMCLESQNSTPKLEKGIIALPMLPKCPELRA